MLNMARETGIAPNIILRTWSSRELVEAMIESNMRSREREGRMGDRDAEQEDGGRSILEDAARRGGHKVNRGTT